MKWFDESDLTVVSGKHGWVIGAFGLIPLSIGYYFDQQMLGQVAGASLCSILFTICLTRKMHDKIWYRLTVLIIIIAHTLLVFVPLWPSEGFSTLKFAPIIVADICLILLIMSIANGMQADKPYP